MESLGRNKTVSSDEGNKNSIKIYRVRLFGIFGIDLQSVTIYKYIIRQYNTIVWEEYKLNVDLFGIIWLETRMLSTLKGLVGFKKILFPIYNIFCKTLVRRSFKK